MAKLYGIPNCTTVKKARDWLAKNGVAYEFHDFKKHGIDEAQLKKWVKQYGWEKVLNKKGQTWRKLPDKVKHSITNDTAAIALMMQQPSIIRRPILDHGTAEVALGFEEAEYLAYMS